MNIGYIGLGAMGGALARRLTGTGQLIVWDINNTAAAAFEELGAAVAPSAAELARQCDIVLLCLPRTSDVRSLIFGAGGLAEGLSAGKLIVDQTSGVPGETAAIARQLAALGIEMIDAPVSGGVSGAAAGTITIMASGAEESFQKALPVLTTISPNVIRCGQKVGDGQAMKLVNNLLSAGCRLATFEVIALARKMGLSLAAITDVLNKGSGRNRTSKAVLQGIVDGKLLSSNFAMALMLKDMNQAIQLGMACGAPTPLTNIVRGLLQIGVNTLGANAPLDKAMDLIESMAGTRLADEAPVATTLPVSMVATGAKTLRVGYVGLGAMGGALVRRLMLSRPVQVFDSRADAVKAFEAEGATAAKDLPSLARDCDVILICVPTSAIVREVIFGPGGLAEGLAPGKLIVDQTTGEPTVTRGIAEDLGKLGVQLVDAPVAGGSRGAVAGTIAIMLGGQAAACAAVWPVLQEISPNLTYCGQSGNGHVAKLISNTVATCNVMLTYEAATLAVRYGLALADMAKVVAKSTGSSAASDRILSTLSEGKASADFQLQLMVKDLRLAGRMAIDGGVPMLIARTVCSLYEMGAQELGGTTNIDAMSQRFEKTAGIQFTGA